MNNIVTLDIEQGNPSWLSLRKEKITATDAPIILGENPWKTPLDLYKEKLDKEFFAPLNAAMQRGIDLEPIARELAIVNIGIDFKPAVIVKDWAMASLDGISDQGDHILEIKCPGKKAHAYAQLGRVPPYYYAQLQHQMYVADVQLLHYFSFDGTDGILLDVPRNDEYIAVMIEKEKAFYDCLQEKRPPK